MPYLNLDLDYFDHRKTRRLIGLLGKGAEVLPIRLWAYCGKFHCEDGRLSGYSEQEIESLAGWWGEKQVMLPAMKTSEWMDVDPQGVWFMHDWQEHQGHLAAFKAKGRAMAKVRWDKARDAASIAHSNATGSQQHCSNHTNQPTKPIEIAHSALTLSGMANIVGEIAKHGFFDEFGNEIPVPLRTVEFMVSLREWHAYKRQRRESYKEIGAKKLLTKLEKLGAPPFVIQCINDSMGNNYSGVFPPKPLYGNSTTNKTGSRNAGTYNEGRAGQYARAAVSGAKKVPDVPNPERSDS